MTNKAEPKKNEIVKLEEPTDLLKPENDTKFAQASAKVLMDIVKQNRWSIRLGGQSEHLMYEAWQTVGKYYGYTVKTHDAEYVEFGNSWGFRAKATVVNEKTGIEVGGSEAYCMNDEKNWGIDRYGKQKPKFQLASMAQTRAGSKALRQILGFVVALAGYNPTPAEEMDANGTPIKDVSEDNPVESDPPWVIGGDKPAGASGDKCPECHATRSLQGKIYHSPKCSLKETA